MSINCLMCENKGTIWANVGFGYQIVQCPECKGKSHKEPDWDAIRANLQKRIAEKKKQPKYHEMDIFECLAEIERTDGQHATNTSGI